MPTRYVTILGSGNTSTAVSKKGKKHIGLQIPADWAAGATSLSFEVGGENWITSGLYKDAGTAVAITVAPGTYVSLDTVWEELAPWRCFKIVSGTLSSKVAQPGKTAASAVFDFGSSKTLTVTSGVKGTIPHEINVAFTNNTSDALSVTKDDDDSSITIALANTTASKNADTAIQTAVRALSTVGGIDVSAMTVAGSTAYDAAPPAGVKATKTITVATDKTLTFTSGLGGTAGNALNVTIQDNTGDTLSVTNPSGSNILVKLANTTGSKNADTAITTALQALGTVGGYDVSAATVTGNAAYDAAPIITIGSYVVSAVALAGGVEAITPIAATNLSGGVDCIIGVVIED